jgi:hypothetical protein
MISLICGSSDLMPASAARMDSLIKGAATDDGERRTLVEDEDLHDLARLVGELLLTHALACTRRAIDERFAAFGAAVESVLARTDAGDGRDCTAAKRDELGAARGNCAKRRADRVGHTHSCAVQRRRKRLPMMLIMPGTSWS